MKLLIIALLCFVSATAATHTPVYITSGEMRCGMILRDPNQIQIWCWSGIVWAQETAILNFALYLGDSKRANTTLRYKSSSVACRFTVETTGVFYEADTPAGTLSGRLE